ncbi:MAG: hypothetical protein HC767_00715 [Akkermansiaceae bacterium]|nr:hypothetical protein [Akkermansiaceae bacterium]
MLETQDAVTVPPGIPAPGDRSGGNVSAGTRPAGLAVAATTAQASTSRGLAAAGVVVDPQLTTAFKRKGARSGTAMDKRRRSSAQAVSPTPDPAPLAGWPLGPMITRCASPRLSACEQQVETLRYQA